jgi:hypothetical protein
MKILFLGLIAFATFSCNKQQIIDANSTQVNTKKQIRGGRAIANIRFQGRNLQDYQANHFDLFLGSEYTYLADVNNTITLKFNKDGTLQGTASVNERSADVASYIWANLTPEATEAYYPYHEIQFTHICETDGNYILSALYEEILRGRRNNGR